jgi:acetyl-CoA synthetase
VRPHAVSVASPSMVTHERAAVIEATGGTTHASLRAGFRWSLPGRFNIGAACADVHAATSLALIEVVDGDTREYTFGQITERSNRLANALAGLGVARGDRVGIMLPQGLDVAVSHLAVYKLGAVAVPLTQLFGPEAVRHRVGDSEARVVITDATTLDTVADVAAELGGVTVVVAGPRATAPHEHLQSLLDAASVRTDVAPTGPDDPAVLIYTSGTTGAPKGALHGHRVLFGHLPGFELMFDFFPRGDDRTWTPADWAWIGGLLDALLPTWFHGRPIVAAPRRRFDPAWAVDLMADHRVSAAFLPPTALKLMRQAGVAGDRLQLRSVMSGGEPLGAEMLAWGRDHLGTTINEIYGQTEANLLVGNSASVWDVRPGSMGLPYPGHDVAILAADGTLAAPGQEGEIVARSPDPVIMLGYWNRPDATAEKFVEVAREDGATDRWLRTGDVGRMDEDGYFWFTARDDDVIISAGYRIGPAEIEECILTHPDVAMVAAVGVPDDVRGEVVKAFVKPTDDRQPSEQLSEEIRDRVRVRLAAYEYPREIEFVDELPLTTTGKIRRRDLRDREVARRSGG